MIFLKVRVRGDAEQSGTRQRLGVPRDRHQQSGRKRAEQYGGRRAV